VSEPNVAAWHEANDNYLAASLKWLRLVLEKAAQDAHLPKLAVDHSTLEPPTESAAPATIPRRRWRLRSRPAAGGLELPAASVPSPVRAMLPAATSITDEDVASAASARAAAAAVEATPALEVLANRLGLSSFERDVLLLCAAMELDPGTGGRCAAVHQRSHLAHPTFALALSVLPEPTWDALSPQRPLRYWRLIEMSQSPGQPLTESQLRADERIVTYLKGLNELDDRLETLVTAVLPGATTLPPSQASVVEEVVEHFRDTPPGLPLPVIQLVGGDARSKVDLAARASAQLQRHLFRLSAELLPPAPDELELVARLWHRESILLSVALYLDAQELEERASALPLDRFLARSDGIFLLGTPEARRGIDRPTFAIDVPRASAAEQRRTWHEALGGQATDEVAAALAAQFDLPPPAIHEIGRTIGAAAPDPATLKERVWDACLGAARARLDALAQRIEPKAHWEDIVLPAAEMSVLRHIADQVGQRGRVYEDWGFADRMSRGLGISVLFTGPSGVGKTMAAEVLANDLRLNLYRIDLSAVVSKYIGETEKNLRRLFDAAEEGPALLFFDEADALFGKRSEVKDSHDRYANIEVNYLLQRMEAYRGLAILATNMKTAMDQAFLRRLRFIVSFPFPDRDQRRAIWERVFPTATPVNGIDYDRLARLPATGGMVHNIALNAAFMAAQRDQAVTMPLILEAARTEFRKLEQPIPDSEFAWAEPTAPETARA
jgi:hypothetical protein